MKKILCMVFVVGMLSMLAGCGGGVGGGVYYRNVPRYSPWWGYGGYYRRDRIIVAPNPDEKEAVNLPVYPDTGGPELEAVPLPTEPGPDIPMEMPMPAEPMIMDEPMMMDMVMGMPDAFLGDF